MADCNVAKTSAERVHISVTQSYLEDLVRVIISEDRGSLPMNFISIVVESGRRNYYSWINWTNGISA